MTTDTPPPDHPTGTEMGDIHLSAIYLAGLLHMLDQFDATDMRGEAARDSGIAIAADRARLLADQIEGVL